MFHLAPEFREHYMDVDDIGIKCIDSRRKNQVESKAAKVTVDPPLKAVREKPPDVLNQMRTWNRGDPVPNNPTIP
jgi:hypothetical protein